tara:strand:+ start:368 stop:499 length:132 start_codon:yes stop_codon:yes gene_type:complete
LPIGGGMPRKIKGNNPSAIALVIFIREIPYQVNPGLEADSRLP